MRSIDETQAGNPVLEVIGRILVANVPALWQRIDVLVDVLPDRAVFVLEYQPDDDRAEPQFFAPRKPEDARALSDCFLRLAQLVTSPRGPMRKCHMHLRSDGHIHADYEY